MGFDRRRINTLELKFKRHKINFDYDSKNEIIVFGKSKNKNEKLIMGIGAIALAIISLLMLIFFEIPMGRLINYIVSGSLCVFGLKQLADFYSLRANNETKILTKNSIQISDSSYLKQNIKSIDFEVLSEDNGDSTGILSILTNEGKISLVTILDEDYKFVKNDMKFLKELILDFMNIQ